MRNWILVVLIILPLVSMGQGSIKIKKKYLGKYTGVISAYQIQSEKGSLNVDETTMELVLKKDAEIDIKIGGISKQATYNVLNKDKKNYTIEVQTESELFIEKLLLNGKEKTITRDGLYPQPNAELEKN